jgi:aromatic-L-amino-acid decarboxylase
VTTGEPPSVIRKHLGEGGLPTEGADARTILDEAATLLFEHSLHNGHPRFCGYITSSAAPIGALADLLAASINANVGAWVLSPVATELERQAIRWIAEMVGYPTDCGGILVSGGNMSNFVCFLAGRRAKAGWPIHETGIAGRDAVPVSMYVSSTAHTWLHKAADMFGHGRDAVRWIPALPDQRMDTNALRERILADKARGIRPIMVVGSAGTVATGTIDPLAEISAVCREFDLWFHVDGAYGAFTAVLPDAPADLRVMEEADSLALDPHKWLYAPIEAGCSLVRDPEHLRAAFQYHPEYYKFDDVAGEPVESMVDFGPQNSRGFRALKVWAGLRRAGRAGYEQMIAADMALASRLHQNVQADPELEAVTCNLSVTTFRYVPPDLSLTGTERDEYLNKLNREILTRLQEGGEAFPSNAVIDGRYLLRACIVNFRTTEADVDALPGIVTRIGRELDASMRPG